MGMAVEAKALLQMVSERFPRSRSWAVGLQREIAAVDGRLDEIVAPLQDVNLAPEIRERIETLVRQRVHDLPALAAVSCLPPEHPLREGAAALVAAFQAVTRGPVDDQVVALLEVPRRSPLARGKLSFVRSPAFTGGRITSAGNGCRRCRTTQPPPAWCALSWR